MFIGGARALGRTAVRCCGVPHAYQGRLPGQHEACPQCRKGSRGETVCEALDEVAAPLSRVAASSPRVGAEAKCKERMMDGNFTIGRFGGIEVRLNWSLIAVFVLIVWSLADGSFPSQNPGLSDGDLPLSGNRRGSAVPGVDPAPRTRPLVGGPARGDRGRLGHALALRRRGGVQGSVRERRRRVPCRPRRAARLDRLGCPVRVDRACRSAERRRRGRGLARVHQPDPGRFQPLARVAARRRSRPACRALASQGRLRLGDPRRVGDRTGLRAISSSHSASRCSSSRARSAAPGSPSSAGTCFRARRRRLATSRRSRR